MKTFGITAFAVAALVSPAGALDFGNGFSLTGEVELDYFNSSGTDGSLSYVDLTLGWRNQGSAAVGFGFDVTFRDFRELDVGDSFNNVWAAAVLTTPYGELSVGRPLPVLSRMFDVPQVGGTRQLDLLLLEAGGRADSFLAFLPMLNDSLDPTGLTFKGTSAGLGYGVGVHRFESGPTSVDAYEGAISYQIDRTELFAGYETLDLPVGSIDRLRLGARYGADRWSVGAQATVFEGPGGDRISTRYLFGDYLVTDALKIGAQILDISIPVGDGPSFYGLTGEYGFGAGGYVQLGVITQKDSSSEAFTASLGYRF